MVRLPFREPSDVPAALAMAADCVARHALIALPTETFYGLAVDPTDATAVNRLLAAKDRPAGKALLVVGADLDQLARLVVVPQPLRERLVTTWPAPLTVVLPLRSPLACAAETLAVRVPAHPLLRALLTRLGPMTATSANRSGAAPPWLPEQVEESLGEAVELLLDGGPTAGGEPSTVVDWCTSPPIVLRRGAFQVPASWRVNGA